MKKLFLLLSFAGWGFVPKVALKMRAKCVGLIPASFASAATVCGSK
jgi:hypothetical protein